MLARVDRVLDLSCLREEVTDCYCASDGRPEQHVVDLLSENQPEDDVAVTTGQTNEDEMIEPQVDEVEAMTGIDIKVVTVDAGYAYAKVYRAPGVRSRAIAYRKGGLTRQLLCVTIILHCSAPAAVAARLYSASC
ncbi:hypothetical protein MTX26_26900 [Bradyrhizobium sp. ISRA443]|uniref:hypothetical protein n=1 Tax=unclassified Bradyrhizobium TaxID=2631580 RepID=UPI00247A9DAC|nr:MULTISPECIES: hypothetical protein [unclassified Bradyrhizobium]WGR93400.1 hypothetical protein MTX20_01700 [Bradyrhizobium sp. ISRA435]WGS02950.1 hypothetical protein MTX23_26895 [Bradyrhizobium sp. ISRA436]WGS09837.1 hypothetical protein MTX18_26905 [Bradyrhizobium sp. ISRA437]WGS16723.1 hypothetical protein MTX26_26900 [Bradyrhizobium sp. ISRA443]